MVNIIVCVSYGASIWLWDMAEFHYDDLELYALGESLFKWFFISYAFLCIVSGAYLIYAISTIKKIISNEILNTKILSVHAAAFGLFMISTLISVVFYEFNHDHYLIADCFAVVCSAITQMIMCYIFYSLETQKMK